MAVYNRAVVGVSESNLNAFDLMAEAYQIDQSLFEAVIEVDFAEAFNEAGIIALTEEEQAAAKEAQKEGILKKAFEAIKKIGKAIEQIFDNIISFISNLIANDAKIKEKYGKYFTSINNFKGCDVKGKYVDFGYVEGMSEIFKRKLNAGGSAAGVEDAGEKGKFDVDRMIINSGDNTIISKIGSNNFTKMVEYVQGGYKTVLEDVKKRRADAIKACNDYEKELNDSRKNGASGANEAYKKAIAATTGVKVTASAYRTMVIKATAHARSCYMSLAKWAAGNTANADAKTAENKAGDQAKNEAYNMLIELESNMFIERAAELV